MPKIAEAARAARRDQIIAAALTCFARAGYHATTMADVAAQAGVSKGTPYLYFESKQALFIALHEEWDCGLGDRVNAAIAALPEAGRRSPRRVLHAVAAAVAGYVLERTQTCRVLMEARALAAHEPPIAAAVLASDARTHRAAGGPDRGRVSRRGNGPPDRPGAGGPVVHRGPVRADGPVAPGPRLVLLGRRRGRPGAALAAVPRPRSPPRWRLLGSPARPGTGDPR